jgi:hypothetical protein
MGALLNAIAWNDRTISRCRTRRPLLAAPSEPVARTFTSTTPAVLLITRRPAPEELAHRLSKSTTNSAWPLNASSLSACLSATARKAGNTLPNHKP